MRMSFGFIAVILLSLFQVSLSFADGFSGGGRGMSGNAAEGKRQPPEKSRSPSSGSGSEHGSERRNLPVLPVTQDSAQDLNNGQDAGDCFNPSTGWHTVSEPVEVVNYRGSRKVVIEDGLSVTKVKAEKSGAGKITVKVLFNQEINPRSFSCSNLKINGKFVTDDVKFSFSNKGDCVRIQIPEQSKEFSLAIDNVEAFDGEKIPEINLGNIQVN